MIRTARIRTAAALIALFAISACENSPSNPEPVLTMARIAGSYGANGSYGAFELTTLEDGVTIDWLEAGGSVEISLQADGTTVGGLTIPEGDEDGSDFVADLGGSWTLEGDTVHFEHAADTFVRDMSFSVVGSTLVGDRTFGDVRVRMVLRKG